jgi:hypothetical protein
MKRLRSGLTEASYNNASHSVRMAWALARTGEPTRVKISTAFGAVGRAAKRVSLLASSGKAFFGNDRKDNRGNPTKDLTQKKLKGRIEK